MRETASADRRAIDVIRNDLRRALSRQRDALGVLAERRGTSDADRVARSVARVDYDDAAAQATVLRKIEAKMT